MKLDTELSTLPDVGAKFITKLKKLGIVTIKDLLWHFPFRYEDYSRIVPIGELAVNQSATIQGRVRQLSTHRTWKKHLLITEAVIIDNTGGIKAVWFNQPYVQNVLREGNYYNFAGKVTTSKREIYLASPSYEPLSKLGRGETKHTAGLIPIYPETRGLTSKGFRYLIKPILKKLDRLEDFIPDEILKEHKLSDINLALRRIHFPLRMEDAENAKRRFAFEDLFLLQLNNLKFKSRLAQKQAAAIRVKQNDIFKLIDQLPFKLTDSQKISLKEIIADIQKPYPMNRLLQGDVGSGKTIVAAIAAISAAKDGYQTAFMAPTEILAGQHYRTLTQIFSQLNGGAALLTAATKKPKLLKAIGEGDAKIIIGTHAVIQKNVRFKNLALAIVDEQHRFGVRQRASLLSDTKNTNTRELHEADRIVEKDLSYKLNGVFFEIQREAGRFLRERQYADLLEQKLKSNSVVYKRESPIEVAGRKSNFADFVIENKILIELKTKTYFEKEDYYQILRYLESNNLQLGLLVNFRQRFLKPKRILNPKFESFACDSGISYRLVPHLLSMSATPIPRTVSLTVFGDLDLSTITELPAGRKEIITKIVAPENRRKAYDFIRQQIQKGRQAFVICPRIEPGALKEGEIISEAKRKALELKSVKEEFEKLSKKIFPDLRMAMLHGKIKSEEKDRIMKDFQGRKYDILVSTSVVEVGVDIPNAAIMMIEGAERFGLAQLYQFRGRVGRAEHQSFCLLFTESDSDSVKRRLNYLLTAKNGFELAEKDLLLRGPGQFLGEKQTGLPDIAMDALKDIQLVKASRDAAKKILSNDPEFVENPVLAVRFREFQKEIHLE